MPPPRSTIKLILKSGKYAADCTFFHLISLLNFDTEILTVVLAYILKIIILAQNLDYSYLYYDYHIHNGMLIFLTFSFRKSHVFSLVCLWKTSAQVKKPF